jgi:hypothetical protein
MELPNAQVRQRENRVHGVVEQLKVRLFGWECGAQKLLLVAPQQEPYHRLFIC